MKWRVMVLLILLAIAATASANGAMGLALEMFELRTWFVYVAVTIVLEAFVIGRAANLNWKKSLGVSLLANFITAATCAYPGCFVPVLHGSFVGSGINPNPFWNSVALLTFYGLVSALVEGFIWAGFVAKDAKSRTRVASLTAHLVGVPVALMILLIPARPYQGLERTINRQRMYFVTSLHESVGLQIRKTNRTPSNSSASALISAAAEGAHDDASNAWAAGYKANFERFDTHEMKREPIEINPGVLGRPVDTNGGQYWVWLIRFHFGKGEVDRGLAIDLGSGWVQNADAVRMDGDHTVIHDK